MPSRGRRGWGALALLIGIPAPVLGQGPGEVSGKLVIADKGGTPALDVADAVIWLEGPSSATRPMRAEIGTQAKTFFPRVVVVTAGSTVAFPNHDPFNHNAFSLSEAGPFDLGLYGRNDTRTASFARAGVVRVYCNVHAQMSAVVVVRDNPHFTQPAVDGEFRLTGVPPGEYLLRVWHERGGEARVSLRVPPAGLAGVALALDASGYTFKPHLNKFGKPYDSEGRRY
jgi:plastocyanin